MKFVASLAFAATGAAIAVVFSPSAHALTFNNTNLIVNGDAEAGTGSNGLSVVSSTPGWSTTGTFTAIQYAAGNGFPTVSDPGPDNRGLNFFGGGPTNPLSTASQLIDLSSGAITIDAGGVTFNLSGFLGGFSTQNDNAQLTATFLSAGNTSLGSASIGPVLNVDRNNVTSLLFRQTTGTLPTSTRFVNLLLTMTRTEGTSNDGYADNLSFALAEEPPNNSDVPVSPQFLATALGAGIGALKLRRQKARAEA
jgi:hypothetical protein